MSGYTKLFSSIITSTIWMEPDHVRLVWVTMLALSDKYGVVEASVPGLAKMAGVSLERCREALDALLSPDQESRTKVKDGRRIEEIDGGWQLVNHSRYRAKLSADERREYFRMKKAESRAKTRVSKNVKDNSDLSHIAEAEAAPDPEAKAETEPAPVWTNRQRTRTLIGSHRSCLSFTADACARGLCVPHFLASQWLAQMDGDEGQVRAFVAETIRMAPDGPLGDNLTFWRGAWQARYGQTAATGKGAAMKASGRRVLAKLEAERKAREGE